MAKVLFVPGATETVGEFLTDVMVCAFTGESLDELQRKHPQAVLGTVAEFLEAMRPTLCTQPGEISAEAYVHALGVLPPQGFIDCADSESFKFLEHIAAGVTTVYARVGKTYWSFRDLYTIDHAAILDKIREHQTRTELAVSVMTADDSVEFMVTFKNGSPNFKAPILPGVKVERVEISPLVGGFTRDKQTLDGATWEVLVGCGELYAFWHLIAQGSPAFAAAILLTSNDIAEAS